MAISCDPTSVLDNSRCIRNCIHPGSYSAIETWLLAKYAAQTTDATQLALNAVCLQSCLSPIQLLAIEVWLWATLAGLGTDPQTLLANAECYETCLAQGQMPGVIWLESILAVTSAVPENLMGQSVCLRGCLGASQFSPINVWLLATKAGQSTDPQTLASNAKCLSGCLGVRQLQAIKLYLMCVLAGGMSSLYLGLIAYWTFDEAPTGTNFLPRVDSYGNFDLLAFGTDPQQQTGKLVRSFANTVGGSTNPGWLSRDGSPSLRLTGGSFSISSWWRRIQLGLNVEAHYIEKSSTTLSIPDYSLKMFSVDASNATWRFYAKSNGALTMSESPVIATTGGAFRHLVVTYDAATGTLTFYNTNVKNSVAVPVLDAGTDTPLRMCEQFPDFSITNATMRIDEVGMWGRALSDAEVSTLFNGGAAKSFPFTP